MTTQDDPPSDPETQDLFCPGCGYNLRGLSDPANPSLELNCPECGVSVDTQKLVEERIPWAYRHEIGRRRAFWKTVNLVMRHPKRFGSFVAGPVDRDAAERFRRAVIWRAFIPLALLCVFGYGWSLWQTIPVIPFNRFIGSSILLTGINEGVNGWTAHCALGWVMEGLVILSLLPALWLALDGLTRLGGIFFRAGDLSAEQRERAAALSCYSCAALARTPFIFAALLITLLSTLAPFSEKGAGLQLVAVLGISVEGLIVAQLLFWLVDTVAMLRSATRCGTERLLAATALLPTLGLLLGGMILVLIPAMVGLIGLIVLSFD